MEKEQNQEMPGEKLYERVRATMAGWFGGTEEKDPSGAERLMESFFIGELEGSIPEAYLGEDLMKDIHDKFYAVFMAIRDEVAESESPPPLMEIFVSPSYEDDTHVLLVHEGRVLHRYSRKAWNLYWDSREEMKAELADIYRSVAGRFRETV